MILSIGEILADMVGSNENGTLIFKSFYTRLKVFALIFLTKFLFLFEKLI